MANQFKGFNPKDFDGEPKPVIITEYILNGALSKQIELKKKSCADHRWNDTGEINHNLRHILSNGIFTLQWNHAQRPEAR